MKKFLLACLVVSCIFVLSICSFAIVVDLSDYDLPDLDTGSDTIYSNQLLTSTNVFIFSSKPLTADSRNIYCPSDCFLTYYSYRNDSWVLEEESEDYSDSDFMTYSGITYANYIVYDNDDPSDIIYQPTQEGGENMSTILTDLSTVMTSVLTNATSLVTWISSNPLVYLWVIMAIIIAIIAFVRGFIRGV